MHKSFQTGQHSWIIRTFLNLKEAGVKCYLTNEIPDEGIIVFHKGTLDEDFIPNINQLLVCIQADWGRHSFAPIFICQNRKQASNSPFIFEIPRKTFFVHFWSQDNIIKRDPTRKSKISTISYFGIKDNLAEELKSDDWMSFLSSNNIEWNVVEEREKWGNYFSSDVVLFCRNFKGTPFHHKPATKLYNTWIAGCLPIFTPESAFIDEIKGNEEAGIVINSYTALKKNIINLNNSPEYFNKIIESGSQLGTNFSDKKITQEWIEIIQKLKKQMKIQQLSPLRFLAFIYMRKLTRSVKKIILSVK
jgi:hypothetical protein